ncbi:unnamed protein product, partial [Ceratitis capitata]
TRKSITSAAATIATKTTTTTTTTANMEDNNTSTPMKSDESVTLTIRLIMQGKVSEEVGDEDAGGDNDEWLIKFLFLLI